MRINQTRRQNRRYLGARAIANTADNLWQGAQDIALVLARPALYVAAAVAVGVPVLYGVRGCNSARDFTEDALYGFSNRDNSLVTYDSFNFEASYNGGVLSVNKEDDNIIATLRKDGKSLEVEDYDGYRILDRGRYIPRNGRETPISRASDDSKLVGLVSKGDEILAAAYQESEKRGLMKTIAD